MQQALIGPIPFGISGTIAFNSKGQIITIRTGADPTHPQEIGNTLLLIDPVNLTVLASASLPPRAASTSGVSFAGGGYFYLNNLDQVVCITANQQLRIYSVQNDQSGNPQFVQTSTYDLSSTINKSQDILNSTLPDSSGNLWFITKLGIAGYVVPQTGAIGKVSITSLPNANPNETNTKSFASDGQGGVYIVTDYALYRFHAAGSVAAPTVVNDWRATYDRGTRTKPGQNQQGSGTTPTVFDDFAGNRFVAIADNADPFMHVNVYNRDTGTLIAQQAVFSAFPLTNSCENSLIAVNHSITIDNNYGNVDVNSTLGPLMTVPGVNRVDFDPTKPLGQNSSVVWANNDVAIPSIVSQLSTADGLEYTYAKDTKGWYWAALDFATGAVVAKTYVPWSDVVGGALANNFYNGLTIGPDGSAYSGVFGGMVVWRAVTASYVAAGTDAGVASQVNVFDANTESQKFSISPYGGFTGGVRVAVGDVTGDGVPDIVTGTGPGGGPNVIVFDGKNGNMVRSFFAFDPNFTAGVYVAAGDFNADGFADVVVGPDTGGGPNVVVLDGKSIASGQTITALFNGFVFNPGFTGGVRVAAGNVDGTGAADLIVGAGPGGGPNVSVLDLNVITPSSGGVTVLGSFFPYSQSFTGGVYVGAGDVNKSGKAAVITGAGQGGGPNVTAFSLNSGTFSILQSFFAYDPGFTGGVRVGAIQQGGATGILTAPGPGGGPQVRVYNGVTAQLIDSFFAFPTQFTGGVFIGGSV